MYTRKHRKIKVRSRKYLRKPSKAKRRNVKKQKTRKMKRYMGGAPATEKAPVTGQAPAPEKTEGFTNPLDKMLKGNKLLARAARVSKVSKSALGIIAKAAEPNTRAKLKELKSNIEQEQNKLQEMTTRENERSAKEKEKIVKQQNKVDAIQAKIDELEPPQGTSGKGKLSTGTSSVSTGMKAPMAKAPMSRM